MTYDGIDERVRNTVVTRQTIMPWWWKWYIKHHVIWGTNIHYSLEMDRLCWLYTSSTYSFQDKSMCDRCMDVIAWWYCGVGEHCATDLLNSRILCTFVVSVAWSTFGNWETTSWSVLFVLFDLILLVSFSPAWFWSRDKKNWTTCFNQ